MARKAVNKKVNRKKSEVVEAQWGKRILALVRFCGIYLVFIAVFLCWRQMYSWIEEQHWFDLKEIDVVGVERVSEKEIIEYSHVDIGISVFELDISKVILQVEAHPWVKHASVTRRLPDALLIEVTEHHPVGLVKLDRIYYVNSEGTPFKVAKKEVVNDFIVIEGLSSSNFEVMEVGQKKVRRALEFINFYKEHPMHQLAALRQVKHRYNGLEIAVGKDRTKVIFGKGNMQDDLDRAAKLWSHLKARNLLADVIHLDNRKQPERVAVQLRSDDPENDMKTEVREHRN